MSSRKRPSPRPHADTSSDAKSAGNKPARRRPLSPQTRTALVAAAVGLEAAWLVFLVWMALGG